MSDAEDFYPFREEIEAAGNFRRIGREGISIAEGPVEIKIGKTSVFIFNPNRDLAEDTFGTSFTEDDCVVATAKSLRHLRSRADEDSLLPLQASNHIVLGREKSPLGSLGEDDYISRVHVLLDRGARGDLTVHDLGSVNGTYVRNLRINKGEWSVPTYYSQTREDEPEMLAGVHNPQVESSVPSDKHPERNEDAAFTDDAHDTLGVFDGVGSSHVSAYASQLAAEYIQGKLAKLPDGISKEFARITMGEVLLGAHQAILEKCRGSETTAAVAKIFRDHQGLDYAVIAYAGDSRAYLLREGKLESLTVDHAFIGGESEMKRKDLQDTLSYATNLEDLNDAERKAFHKRNIITSALGQAGTPTISFATIELKPADVLILTSDGVHDNLTTTEIQNVAASVSFFNLADELVDAAHTRSQAHHFRSKQDDITAAAVAYQG